MNNVIIEQLVIEQLVRRVVCNNETTLVSEIVEMYIPVIEKECNRYYLHRMTHEDMLHDVILTLMEKLHNLEHIPSNSGAYIYNTIRYAASESWRENDFPVSVNKYAREKMKVAGRESVPVVNAAYFSSFEDLENYMTGFSEKTPEEAYMEKTELEKLHDCLECLSSSDRGLILDTFEGVMSVEQICEKYGITVCAYRKRKYRILIKLREMFSL